MYRRFYIGTKKNSININENKKEKTIYYYGYINYRNYINKIIKYINTENIEKLIICCSSAGGFATSFLSEDIIKNYFSTLNGNKITSLVDARILISNKWKNYLELWGVPSNITNNLNSDNFAIDCLLKLREKC